VLERTSRGDVVRRPAGALGRVPTAATYDVVTEGLTGWRFVITKRWIGYIACAVVFAVICGFLSHWQLDRGRQAVDYNALVHANFYAAPVPLASELPKLTSYQSGQDWKRVEVTGRYLASDQLFVRNRARGGDTGFEVLTPLRTAAGDVFVVDRGWVGAADNNTNYPAAEPKPPRGPVTVVARLEASEPAFGGTPSIKNQIESIDLTQVKQRVGGRVYTGAYGLLDTQTPAASTALKPLVTSPPTVGEGLHWSYMIQWILFALIGFFGLGYAIRTEFRRINADDPEEQAREAERVRKRALKAFTDEETEDEILDGFIPLSRWGLRGGAITAAPAASAAALPHLTHAIEPTSPGAGDPDALIPDVYVIHPNVVDRGDGTAEKADRPSDSPGDAGREGSPGDASLEGSPGDASPGGSAGEVPGNGSPADN
jgi:cytochrome oxidase assembly protein ShyY1